MKTLPLALMCAAAVTVSAACKDRAPAPPDVSKGRPAPDVSPSEPDAGAEPTSAMADPLAALGPFRKAADVPPDTPLYRLVTEGLCYEAEGHDFVVCTADHLEGHDRDDGPVAVGRDNRLHIARASGATRTGNDSASSFNDARFFEYKRRFNHANPGEFVARLSAPGYGRHEPDRYLACGPAVFELRAVAPGKSRDILTTWELLSKAPTVSAGVRRAEDGTMLADVTRSGDGIPTVHALYAGKPGGMRRLEVVRRNIVMDGGSVVYDLPRGGRAYFKAYMALFQEGAPAVEYPDGTKFEAGFVPADFEWSTFRPQESAPEQKLYVPTEDKVAAVRRELGIASPEDITVLGPCSAAFGPPPDPDAIVNEDGTPRPFGACSPDDRHVCMGVGRVGFDKSCRDGQCYFQPKESF